MKRIFFFLIFFFFWVSSKNVVVLHPYPPKWIFNDRPAAFAAISFLRKCTRKGDIDSLCLVTS
jgi:hypothetical protein